MKIYPTISINYTTEATAKLKHIIMIWRIYRTIIMSAEARRIDRYLRIQFTAYIHNNRQQQNTALFS